MNGRTHLPRGGRTTGSVVSVFAIVLHLAFCNSLGAQDDPKSETQIFALTLKPNGPPVPSFRYEFVPSFRNQSSTNAALLQHRALHLLADRRPAAKEYMEARDKFDLAWSQPLKDFPKDQARTFLQQFGGVFREMEAAAKCKRCEWGLEDRMGAEGIGLLMPDAQHMRDLSFLLALRCRLHAAEGKIDLALKDIQTGFALARHASVGGTLIHFLIGAAITTQVVTSLEQVMQLRDCPNLYWSLTAMPRPFIDIRKAMEGELRTMDAVIPFPKDVDKGPMSPEESLAALDRLWAGVVKLADEKDSMGLAESRLGMAFFITMQHPSARKSLLAAGKTEPELDAMPPAQVVMLDALVRFRNLRDEHYVWFNTPYAEAMQGMRKSEETIKELRQSPPFNFLQTMLVLLLPAVDKLYGASYRTERQLASLRAVEAVRLYAAKNDGKLPVKLADATVPVPADPITGQPFGYAVDGNTFTIDVPPPPGIKAERGNHWKYAITLTR
jgi:hypothetical protein